LRREPSEIRQTARDRYRFWRRDPRYQIVQAVVLDVFVVFCFYLHQGRMLCPFYPPAWVSTTIQMRGQRLRVRPHQETHEHSSRRSERSPRSNKYSSDVASDLCGRWVGRAKALVALRPRRRFRAALFLLLSMKARDREGERGNRGRYCAIHY
jgi:hypothetical protein